MSALPKPMLTLGSVGEAVRRVQQALNLAPTKQPRLAEDAIFGPKTFARTREFQSDAGIKPDGWVGPQTYGELEAYFKLAEQVAQALPGVPTTVEAALRQRIVQAAQTFLAFYGGWTTSPLQQEHMNPVSPWIAATRGVGPWVTIPGSNFKRQPRQGGIGLAYIFHLANEPSMNCMMISKRAMDIYSGLAIGTREELNRIDVPSWCGIFATACYRTAGLYLTWPSRAKWLSDKKFTSLHWNEKVYAGDIGVKNPNNHHFVIIKDAEPGEEVQSIDGNVANPLQGPGHEVPNNSIIARRTYPRSVLAAGKCEIYRPNFEVLLKSPRPIPKPKPQK
jgi:peptidoglycan hydrolase-like protein with peptidoglycan-binding domain